MSYVDHAGYTAPTRHHELDRAGQDYTCPEGPSVDHELGIDDLSEVLSLAT